MKWWDNTADTLKLIQVLANHGCKYNVKVSENDYYVADDEELLDPIPKENTRYFAALKNDDGRNVKVISFEDFLAIIDLTTDRERQYRRDRSCVASGHRLRKDDDDAAVLSILRRVSGKGLLYLGQG